jgi:hypothetical protein
MYPCASEMLDRSYRQRLDSKALKEGIQLFEKITRCNENQFALHVFCNIGLQNLT